MKMFVISDNIDTLTGLRMVGITGSVVHTEEELKREIEKIILDSEIGIVLIMEQLSKKFPEVVKEIKLDRPLPLLVEIPDRHGTGRTPDFITAYVKEAIGVKL